MTGKFCLTWLLACAAAVVVRAGEPADTIAAQKLHEVVVTGNSARQRIDNIRLGAERLELSKLVAVPSLGGERDVIKSMSLLPGVRSEGDGGGGFEVRGGNAYQNLVVLDGMALYNPSHVLGIFSTFNDNAIGSATLYKGPFPAMYGDASSSVLETSLAPGDMERYQGSLSVGILATKIAVQGPVVKDKLSFAVAARRSYVDAFLEMVPQYRGTIMNFYDASAKIRWTPSAAHLVDGSFYICQDNMAVADLMGFYWGNLAASLNWVARSGEGLNFHTSASMTRYRPKMSMEIMNMNQAMRTYIHNYSVNEKATLRLAANHGLEFGVGSELLQVKSGEWRVNTTRELEIRSLWENAVWIDYAGKFADRIEVMAGIRLNTASVLSQGRFHEYTAEGSGENQFDAKTYVDVEPRLSLKYALNACHNVKAGFGVATQNLHAIRSSATSFPSDRFALTSAVVRPERSVQWSLGYTGMTENGDFDWSAETYYRDMDNVYDFKDGRGIMSDIALENIILGGKGRSYGAEFMIRKNTGRLTGWVSYTLSQTQTKIPGINNGKWYDATNDRRHDFSVTAIYKLNDKWNLSGSWIFMSGQPLTAPDVKYELAGQTCYYYSGRNTYKTPPIHRLDLSATYVHTGNKRSYEWAFGVYNAYCRYNPYVVYFEDDSSKPSGTRAVQQALYGLVPSVSYTLKF